MSNTFKDNPPAENPLTDEQKRRFWNVALQEGADFVSLLARFINNQGPDIPGRLGSLATLADRMGSYLRRTFVSGDAEVGSKLHPGEFDCYAEALPDEPLFVLLGRDDGAPDIVDLWAERREFAVQMGDRPQEDLLKVKEARLLAERMRQWRVARYGAWRRVEVEEQGS